MRIRETTKQFRKDFSKLKKSGRRDMQKLKHVMEKLINEEILPPSLRDHPLRGKWQECRDCHIEGDWVLVYKISRDKKTGREVITFCATDNHSNLFQ